jgi:hypothetical protein
MQCNIPVLLLLVHFIFMNDCKVYPSVRTYVHIHSKKFLHGKIFICMLHRGHFQENMAKFLFCTQLGLIRDVASLVNEITYL